MNVHSAQATSLGDRYMDLLIKSLIRFDGVDDFVAAKAGDKARFPRNHIAAWMQEKIEKRGLEVMRRIPFSHEARTNGRDWPQHADSMVGLKRLRNVQFAARTAIEEGIAGDFVETGVWRGGSSILLRAALEAYGDAERRVWACDSFEGLPPPDIDRYPQDAGAIWHTYDNLAVSVEEVKANFNKYNLLDDRVQFLKGWFKDTLATVPIEKIAVLRLDGDMYASTMDALNPLYGKVSAGGFIIIDDYGLPEPECRRAIEDFRASRGIITPLIDIDGWGKYWRKE